MGCIFSRLDAASWAVIFIRKMLATARLQQDVGHRVCEHIRFPSMCVCAAIMSIGLPFLPGPASSRDRGGKVPYDNHNRELGYVGYSKRQKCRVGCPWIAPGSSWAPHGSSVGCPWVVRQSPLGNMWNPHRSPAEYTWVAHGLPV